MANSDSASEPTETAGSAEPGTVRKFLSVFQYSRVAMKIVWGTSAALTLVMAATTVVSGVLPAAIASVGGLFVDAVTSAIQDTGDAASAASPVS